MNPASAAKISAMSFDERADVAARRRQEIWDHPSWMVRHEDERIDYLRGICETLAFDGAVSADALMMEAIIRTPKDAPRQFVGAHP